MKQKKYKFKNLKIRQKMLISNIGIILIMTVLIGGVGYFFARNLLVSRSVRHSEELMEQLSSNINYAIESLENLVMMQTYNKEFSAMLRKDPEGTGSKAGYDRQKKAESYGYNLIQFNKYIKTVIISDNYDNIYYATDGSLKLGEKEQKACLDQETVYDMWGITYWKPYDEGQVFASKLIFDYMTMKPIGVVSIGVDSGYFEEMYQNILKDEANSIVVMNQNQEILLASDPDTKEMAGNIMGKYAGDNQMKREIIYGDQKYIYTIWSTEGKGIQVMNLLSESAITADIFQILQPVFLIVLLAVALSVVLSAVISGQISSNIRLLLDHIQKISKGDFSQKIVPDSYDEIGMLAEKFNEMSEQIQILLKTVTNEKILKKNSEIKALQFEYDSLQAKINPHFLYNTLESINSLAKLNGEEQIADSIYLLGNYLRDAISSKRKFVPLEEEIQNIKQYIQIQKLSYGEKIQVKFDLEEALMETVVPKLILQPLVENAIVHGIEPKIGPGTIKVFARCQGKDMCLVVWDDGVGIQADQMVAVMEPEHGGDNRHTKVGLMAVHKRIRILYGEEYGITVDSTQTGGTQIAVKLPIKFEDEVESDEV